MQTKLNSKGFGLVGILVIVFVVAIAGTTGTYIYHKDHHNKKATTSNSTVGNESPLSSNGKSSTSTTADPYAGWKVYVLPVEKLNLMYPSDWTISNVAPTSTQDDTSFTSSGGFTLSIKDGVSNGGDSIPEVPTNAAIPITFVGQPDYLMFTYGTGSVGQGSSDGLVAGAVLQTSTNEYGGPGGEHPWPMGKYAVGPNDTTGTVNANYMLISCGFKSQLTLQQASNNADFKNAKLIIASMHY